MGFLQNFKYPGSFKMPGGSSGGGAISGPPVPLNQGGTGATTQAGARTALDVPSIADLTSGLAGKADADHTHTLDQIDGGASSGLLQTIAGVVSALNAAGLRTFAGVYSSGEVDT